MASEANASWHPAMMPHTDADIPTTSHKTLDASAQTLGADKPSPLYEASDPPEQGNDQPDPEEPTTDLQLAQDELVVGPERTPKQDPDPDPDPDSAPDPAPDTDTDPHPHAEPEQAPEHSPGPLQEREQEQEPEPEQEQEQQVLGHESAPAAETQPTPEETAEEEEAQALSGPGHASKDSFARTVSSDPNLEDDDDETSWNIPRSDNDLFKFMPPTTRTNSFPVVPERESSQRHGHVRQLSTIQAEDIVHQIEHETENLAFDDNSPADASNAVQQNNFWATDDDDDDAEAGFLAQLGGDIHNPDEEASDARYAEGVPLISRDQEDSVPDDHEVKARDPFAEDDTGAGDDFFAQIGGSAAGPGPQDFAPPRLDRKSTTQVLQGLNGHFDNGPVGKLDSPIEEDEGEFLDELPVDEQQAEPPLGDKTAAGPGTAPEPPKAQGEDLASKWSQAFAEDEDEDFLLEDHPAEGSVEDQPFDPSAFLVDDDDGFLEDSEDPVPQLAPVQAPASASQAYASQATGVSSKYLPANAAQPAATLSRQPSNPYFPSASPVVPQPQFLGTVPPVATSAYGVSAVQPLPPYGAPPVKPAVAKGQSFADKSKGGYQSPYDLPMEVVKPRKRPSMQQLPRGASSAALGPPLAARSASTGLPASPGLPGQVPPPQGVPQLPRSASYASPPTSNHSGQSPSLAKASPQAGSRAGFFEELPMSHKPRPGSRASNKGQPSPSQASFNGPPQAMHPATLSVPTPPQEPSFGQPAPTAGFTKLVPPAPSNPYAALPAAASSAPSSLPPATSRYSPASSQGSAASGVVPLPSRYSPAPPVPRTASYGPSSTAQPVSLAHLPRTSSPLAHFEARPAASHVEQPSQLGRGSSTMYEPRLNRVPSLPPTREVEEEDTLAHPLTGVSATPASQYPPGARQHDSTPVDSTGTHNLTPPKRRISYGPVPLGTDTDVEPPPRSQTGSPSAMYGLRSPIKASDTVGRPLSAQGHIPPSYPRAPSQPDATPTTFTQPRGSSQKLDLIPPTDGRELDVLQRWKGAPLISWGVGGTLVTSFPVDVPRYGMNQVAPMMIRSPGEIKVKTIKDVQPLEDRLAKFPGPLKGKSKKKEAVAWLTAGIEELEKGLPVAAFQGQLLHEDKRAVERVLLWKLLRIMVENDGMLEGNAVVDKTVREVLSLASSQADVATPIYANGPGLSGFAGESSTTQMQPDSVDAGTVQRLKKSLLAGERETAVWDAADKRLWGHALLIANTVSPDLYHKVSQEFIKKEVNFPGHNNESLAALYSVLSGNHEESIDELVPVHARAGVQMLGTSIGPTTGSGMDGLEKWRETLSLILSNRSNGDAQAVNSLGNLLSGYGRAEAAHICFLFARPASVFGGVDDARAQFVLVGADHRTQAQQFFKETEPLLLSEVYEYGLSLTGTPSLLNGVAHLSVYKLQHAMTLAEHGLRDKALQYCELILKDMSAQTRRSPYHHAILESAVEDLRQRILQAPNKEGSNSWISKPSMDKVSSSVWSRFNKFVAGDEVDTPSQASPKLGDESGPFAGLQGGTPTVSRPPSSSGATGMEMFSSPNGYPGAPSIASKMSPTLTRTASRYAPTSVQSPAASSTYNPSSSYAPSGRSSMERTSGEYSRSPYEPQRASDLATGPIGGFVPAHAAASAPVPAPIFPDAALGISHNSAYQPAPPTTATTASAPTPSHASGPETPSFSPYTPISQQSPDAPATTSPDKTQAGNGQGYGYEPASFGTVAHELSQPAEEPTSSGGYEPPSYQPYGYEPPSYQPDAEMTNEENGDGTKPKRSFMDDDDERFPLMSTSQTAEKSKAQKDKENEELFRKAAEEDAKRAEEEKAAKSKKGWGFGGWFGGGAKKDSLDSASPNKPIRAKLGEKSSFVYDPDQKRWVNKAAGAEDQAPKTATPPPPRMPRAATSAPMPPGTPPPAGSAGAGGLAVPPPNQRTVSMPVPGSGPPNMPSSATPPMMRTASSTSNGPLSAPPSRPATSMSNASSIDDLLGAAVPRKGGAKSKKKGGRYVDVMAK